MGTHVNTVLQGCSLSSFVHMSFAHIRRKKIDLKDVTRVKRRALKRQRKLENMRKQVKKLSSKPNISRSNHDPVEAGNETQKSSEGHRDHDHKTGFLFMENKKKDLYIHVHSNQHHIL